MSRLEHMYIRNSEQQTLYEALESIQPELQQQAKWSDENNLFSNKSVELLKEVGYHTLTVPKSAGGYGASIYDLLLFQEKLAQADPAIALAWGWHLSVVLDINERQNWSEANIHKLNKSIVEQGYLINRAATEPTSGSPTRGAKMTTSIEHISNDEIIINGRKTFTSLSPALDVFLVIASDDEERVEVAVPKEAPGLSIASNWDMLGMKGTASHDLVLDQVRLPKEAIVYRYPKQSEEAANATLLHIPACYLGIALAARQEAISFAQNYQPGSLTQPIIHTNHVKQHLGEMEMSLHAARSFMYYVAERYDRRHPAQSTSAFIPELTSVKIFALRTALDVVDRAMRIVGVHSLNRDNALQRLYRDVRFGLHNPPMEDAVIMNLAKKTIADIKENTSNT